jgi:glycosyltransferase involved in cell wall biosynthesis
MPVTHYGMIALPGCRISLGFANLAVLRFAQAIHDYVAGRVLTVIETLSCGIPVVSWDIPALACVIDDGRTDQLVAHFSPSPIADTMLPVFSDPDATHRTVEAGCADVVATFDWRVLAKRYRALPYSKPANDTNPPAAT